MDHFEVHRVGEERIQTVVTQRRDFGYNPLHGGAYDRFWNGEAAAEMTKKLFELAKSVKDREVKRQIDEILDSLRELKQSASEAEDENRQLREKLRFRGEDFEFRTPFYYEKARPEQPLCTKCFAGQIIAPMGEPGHQCEENYRRCLVCGETVEVSRSARGSGGLYARY